MDEEVFDDAVEEMPMHDMMELFETLSFSEKWHKVFEGLKMPPDTGEYKWAKLQIKRLWGPACGVVVPIILLLLMTLVAGMTRQRPRRLKVIIREELPVEELEEPPDIEEEPLEPPEPTEVEFDDAFNEHDVMMDDAEPTPPSDFAPQPAKFDSVALIKSPVIMRGIYGSRSPGSRGRARGRYGGSGMTEGAVMRALRWLKKYQNQDGSWNQYKPAMTGLALLTFLAHGETPASDEFGMTVEYAIKWLIENQTGDGRFNGRDGHDYSQPIAAYALAEAYGLTRVPTVKEAAEKAVNVVIRGQNPSGGFNYNLAAGGGTRNDSSYMSWCCQALKAAYMAGLNCDGLDQAMTKSIAGWKCNYGGTYDKGGFGYTGPSSSHGLTAGGALSLQLMGQSNSKMVTSAMNAMENAGFWGQGSYSKTYYSYYLTQAKFHEGGARWKAWNKLFSPTLIKHQIVEKNAIEGPDGKMKDIGHWAPGKEVSGHTDPEGRVMNTCLNALQLQVYYRYLPTFQKPDELPVADLGGGEQDAEVDIQIDGG